MCEGRIEKIRPEDRRLASRGLPNGDPEGRILLSYPHMNSGLFFLLTTVFIDFFKKNFQKSLNTLRCNNT